MATPSTIAGNQLYIKVVDSNSPDLWNHPCLMNMARGVQFTTQTNEVYVYDCDDPTAPAIRDMIVSGVAMTATGEGKLDTAALSAWLAWHKAGTAKSVQVWFNTIGYVQVNMKLTAFEVSGDPTDYANVSVTLESHGEIGDYTAA